VPVAESMSSFGFVLVKQNTKTISAATNIPAGSLFALLLSGLIALFGAVAPRKQEAFA